MKKENVLTKEKPVKYREPISLAAEDLVNQIMKTNHKIGQFVTEHNLIPVRGKEDGELQSVSLIEWLNSESKNGKKRLSKKMFKLNNSMSLKRINSFVNFIRNKIYKTKGEVYLTFSPSLTEQAIIESRNNYRKLQEEIEIARNDYRSKKKDYQGKRYFA